MRKFFTPKKILKFSQLNKFIGKKNIFVYNTLNERN